MVKLSSLLRAAIGKYPQGKNYYWDNGVYCALGAATMAGGYKRDDFDRPLVGEWLDQQTGISLHNTLIPMPEGTLSPGTMLSVYDAVIRLNDNYDWTFEQIANYLESQGY